MKKALIAMSGGVDSSVAAYLPISRNSREQPVIMAVFL